ncbi:hypothetical protein L3N51_01107 [Metallosphaera sp. J1]|uniref:DUF5622 domain-containing protein n=1 Tax=Metallosphaera TaxID=41980 RepID=UPI001EE103C8|nr:DUF5622 domain-containing protein [Metallosphaera javensis (ex Hofmann et al. 2022)]MCG3108819.1 hypothetical protein [Metallosphaera javensis (ex Hofmann et al. 2022)]BCS94248.1 MAG: LSU ribosomal protein L46a [Metallosphaera javensis (ex Sakai et al. 2022)]
MALKHEKYVYVEVGKSRYAKLRVLKNKDENSPERYIVLNSLVAKKSRDAKVLKMDDLPLEVREKLKGIS